MPARARSKSRGYKSKKLRTIERKPIRPLERQRMRPWLFELLDSQRCNQLVWMSRKDQTFRVAWKHAAGQTFDPESDASLFELWARHTGKYYTGDKPDAKKWKANFRCALNSLPDVDEDRALGVRKGNNAFKVYKFLEEKKQKRNKTIYSRRDSETMDESDDELRPYYRASGTRSRPKKVVQQLDLDSEGSENDSVPSPAGYNSSETEDHEERSPLPKFEELCQPFPQQYDTSFAVPEQRVPETHSPQASDDNDDGCSDTPTDEDIVDTISDMLTDEPNKFWALMNQSTDDAPDIYLDTSESVLGPSVIVETVGTEQLMQDYTITSLDLSQL